MLITFLINNYRKMMEFILWGFLIAAAIASIVMSVGGMDVIGIGVFIAVLILELFIIPPLLVLFEINENLKINNKLLRNLNNGDIEYDSSKFQIENKMVKKYFGNELNVIIPEGVTSIRRSAFCNCSSLTSVTIPTGVTSIESCAFFGCSRLANVTIPASVTKIESGAFYNCGSLTTIHYGGTKEGWNNINMPSDLFDKAVTIIRSDGSEWTV